MNARAYLFPAAAVGLLLGACAGDGYDDGGPGYADAGFYGDAWYDAGGSYNHPPYGNGYWDRDHHWQGGGGSAPAPGHAEPAGHPAPAGHAPSRGVPSVPKTPRPSGGGHASGGGGGHSGGGGGGGHSSGGGNGDHH